MISSLIQTLKYACFTGGCVAAVAYATVLTHAATTDTAPTEQELQTKVSAAVATFQPFEATVERYDIQTGLLGDVASRTVTIVHDGKDDEIDVKDDGRCLPSEAVTPGMTVTAYDRANWPGGPVALIRSADCLGITPGNLPPDPATNQTHRALDGLAWLGAQINAGWTIFKCGIAFIVGYLATAALFGIVAGLWLLATRKRRQNRDEPNPSQPDKQPPADVPTPDLTKR